MHSHGTPFKNGQEGRFGTGALLQKVLQTPDQRTDGETKRQLCTTERFRSERCRAVGYHEGSVGVDQGAKQTPCDMHEASQVWGFAPTPLFSLDLSIQVWTWKGMWAGTNFIWICKKVILKEHLSERANCLRISVCSFKRRRPWMEPLSRFPFISLIKRCIYLC